MRSGHTGHRQIDTESPLAPDRNLTPDADEGMILALLIARNPVGLELAYERWAAVLYAVALKITQRQDSAERSLFDAYLELWRHPDLAVNRSGSLLRYLGGLVIAAGHAATLDS